MSLIQEIEKKLISKIKKKVCIICDSEDYMIKADHTAHVMYDRLTKNINLHSPVINCGLIICKNCGHIEYFCLKQLGIRVGRRLLINEEIN